MSGITSIEWADATWNPIRGCSRVSEGCRNCYAERQASRFAGPGRPYEGLVRRTKAGPRWTGDVRLVRSALGWPLAWRGAPQAKAEGRRSRIFVNSMSDLFHEKISREDIAAVFGVMAAAPQHDFLVLTKRPERMREWYAACHYGKAPLPNVWVGASVEDQPTANERITHLLACPAAVRWVSYEPALGPVDFTQWLYAVGGSTNGPWIFPSGRVVRGGGGGGQMFTSIPADELHWLIVGGESGPGARPCHISWVRSAVEQGAEARVPVFVKQLGAAPQEPGCAPGHPESLRRLRDRSGSDPSEWPEDLRVREWPRSGASAGRRFAALVAAER